MLGWLKTTGTEADQWKCVLSTGPFHTALQWEKMDDDVEPILLGVEGGQYPNWQDIVDQSCLMHQYGGVAYTWQASPLRAWMMVACLDQL
jgi:hypothetical protein